MKLIGLCSCFFIFLIVFFLGFWSRSYSCRVCGVDCGLGDCVWSGRALVSGASWGGNCRGLRTPGAGLWPARVHARLVIKSRNLVLFQESRACLKSSCNFRNSYVWKNNFGLLPYSGCRITPERFVFVFILICPLALKESRFLGYKQSIKILWFAFPS